MNLSILPSGKWSADTSITGPGSFVLAITAYDAEGLESEGNPSMLVITPPEENDVRLTFGWKPPVENETIGVIEGAVLHAFPETCSVIYRPSDQNSAVFLTGNLSEVDGTYMLALDTDAYSNKGVLEATCGLFEESEDSIAVDLPLPPEPVGDEDQDGVLNDVDACPETPADEPVYSTGCSDSETDDDGDGVVNSNDRCPNTASEASVDANGCADAQKDTDGDGLTDDVDACPDTPAGEEVDAFGCSASQKDDDNDGVSNDVDASPQHPCRRSRERSRVLAEPNRAARAVEDPRPPRRRPNRKRPSQHAGHAGPDGKLSDYEFVFASTPWRVTTSGSATLRAEKASPRPTEIGRTRPSPTSIKSLNSKGRFMPSWDILKAQR